MEFVQDYERSGLSAPRIAGMASVTYQPSVAWGRKDGTDDHLSAANQLPVLHQIDTLPQGCL
jgi:hypothetical protein